MHGVRCKCGGELEIISIPYEMYTRCKKCNRVHVFLPWEREFKVLYLKFLEERFAFHVEMAESIRRTIRKIKSELEEKGDDAK